MEKYLGSEYIIKCKKDINEIVSEISEYLPKIKFLQFKKSIIINENTRILCREIKEKENTSYKMVINFLNEYPYVYTLLLKNNNIFYEKDCPNENEKIWISLNKNIITRKIRYSSNQNSKEYKEKYYLDNPDDYIKYLESESLQELTKNLKNSFVKKRRK